ncbi:MAG: adenylyltransferase/cytidyltransferase family protein, partial [Ktedonobacterales bacterium]
MREDNPVVEEAAAHTIVVVTGVFDLLHIGHLRFLEAARHLGD